MKKKLSKYPKGGTFLTAGNEYHRIYKNADGDIMVNHPKEDKGKWDTINLTDKAGAKTVADGVAATKKWHRENPYGYGGSIFNYPDGGLINNTMKKRTLNRFANGGKVNDQYRKSLQQTLAEPTIDKSALMDAEYTAALQAGKDKYKSSVTGLDYKVLPKAEKRALVVDMWRDLHGKAPNQKEIESGVKAIEGKKVSSEKAKEIKEALSSQDYTSQINKVWQPAYLSEKDKLQYNNEEANRNVSKFDKFTSELGSSMMTGYQSAKDAVKRRIENIDESSIPNIGSSTKMQLEGNKIVSKDLKNLSKKSLIALAEGSANFNSADKQFFEDKIGNEGGKKLVPTSLRALATDIVNKHFGGNSEITEKMFTKDQLKKIEKLALGKIKKSELDKNTLAAINSYNDYKDVDDTELNDMFSQFGSAKNVRNTIGRFNPKIENDTLKIQEWYDFNEKQNNPDMSLDDWYTLWKAKGYSPGSAAVRSLGSRFGSAPGENNTRININIPLTKNELPQHSTGATVGSAVGAGTGMALNLLVPGLGTVAAPALGILGSKVGEMFDDQGPSQEELQRQQETADRIKYGPKQENPYVDVTQKNFNFPYGGVIDQHMANPNAELELEETFQTPDGTVGRVDGPSHDNGGIEVNLPEGTKIFSDRLKYKNGRTYAQITKPITTKIAKLEKKLQDNPQDVASANTVYLLNQQLDHYFDDQETNKSMKEMKRTLKMANGGMIKRADGSYSRRGLWDNIRANKGSGKKPTKEMLEQERKIKAQEKAMGGYMYAEGGINNPGFRALPEYVQEKIIANMEMGGYMYPIGGKLMNDPMFAEGGKLPKEVLMPRLQAHMSPAEVEEYLDEYGSGGYTVRKTNERKGKTHVVIGPDGTKKYFGDPKMGEKGKSKYGKEAFYARHKKNLDKNPYFRAYARATWQEGGTIGEEGMNQEPLFEYKDGGIYIKPENRGKFTAYAKAHGKGVQEMASHIMANKEDYSPTLVKRANFAKNAAKWKHEHGGYLPMHFNGNTVGDPDGVVMGAINPRTGQPYTRNEVAQYAANKDMLDKMQEYSTEFDGLRENVYGGLDNQGRFLFSNNYNVPNSGPDKLNKAAGFNLVTPPSQVNPQLDSFAFAKTPQTTETKTNNFNTPRPFADVYAKTKNSNSNNSLLIPEFFPDKTKNSNSNAKFNFQAPNYSVGIDNANITPGAFQAPYYSVGRGFQAPGEVNMDELDLSGLGETTTPATRDSSNVDDTKLFGSSTFESKPNLSLGKQTKPESWASKNMGTLGQIGAGLTGAALRAYNLSKIKAPGKLSSLDFSSSMYNPDLVDYSANINAANRAAISAMDEAQRGFGSSATAQAFKNKARLNQLETTGKIYQGQENANKQLLNEARQRNQQVRMQEQAANQEIAKQNMENAYNYEMWKQQQKNQIVQDLMGTAGDVFGGMQKFRNQKDIADILSRSREGTVNKDVTGGTDFGTKKQAFGGMIREFKDGGIHIKPENRGKFTATKKRTGKSTEELTHSKNPLTRKRAIFAQNAKKWAKK